MLEEVGVVETSGRPAIEDEVWLAKPRGVI